MAIFQISQITQRKGLQIDLPQLAGAELGWSVDERRLWIGNGTLEEGAPVVGNTEILTEFSDVFKLSAAYTYAGTAGGYTVQTGPTPGDPISMSLQSWMDQWASVKDFGATGDGTTDDTDAINRALYQIYCRGINPQIRRSLFFPAGTYLITAPLAIPPYATLYGEGIDNSIIVLSSETPVGTYVAVTADSLQQTGVNIGNNGAITPRYVTVNQMSFASLNPTSSLMLLEDVFSCEFNSVRFAGPLTQSNLTSASNDSSSVRFASTSGLVTSNIKFTNCQFDKTTYGITTASGVGGTDQTVNGVVADQCEFNTLYQGVVAGTETPAGSSTTGIRIINSVFDNIYAEGIVFGDVVLNASGYNIFYDVGNHFLGITNPYTAIIDIQSNNNVSIGDLFARQDAYANDINPGTAFPRVTLNNTTSFAFTNSSQISLGTFTQGTGQIGTLLNNQGILTTIQSDYGYPLSINTLLVPAFTLNYTIVRGSAYRTGSIVVASDSGATDLTWTEDYTENKDTGISLTVVQNTNLVDIQYGSDNTGLDATIKYSLNYLV